MNFENDFISVNLTIYSINDSPVLYQKCEIIGSFASQYMKRAKFRLGVVALVITYLITIARLTFIISNIVLCHALVGYNIYSLQALV